MIIKALLIAGWGSAVAMAALPAGCAKHTSNGPLTIEQTYDETCRRANTLHFAFQTVVLIAGDKIKPSVVRSEAQAYGVVTQLCVDRPKDLNAALLSLSKALTTISTARSEADRAVAR